MTRDTCIANQPLMSDAAWFTAAVQNVRFCSNRLWKSHPPDRFDFIYTRLLFHTGELYKRFSETTVYDVLAGIEIGFSSGKRNENESEMSTAEDQEVQDILLPGTCPTDDTHQPTSTANPSDTLTADPSDDAVPAPKKCPVKEEWFSHPRVQSYVAQQVKIIDEASDDFITFVDNYNEQTREDCDITQVESAYWEKVRTVGHNPMHNDILYNNPFDPRLFFKGILPTEDPMPSYGLDPMVECPGTAQAAPANILLGVANTSTLTEQHYSRYRSFMRSLSRRPVIREGTIMLPSTGTQPIHDTDVHPQEVLNMEKDIPIDWHKLTSPEVCIMRRVLDDKVKVIWKLGDADTGDVMKQLPPGPIRRPSGTLPWMRVGCEDVTYNPAEVFIPAFLGVQQQYPLSDHIPCSLSLSPYQSCADTTTTPSRCSRTKMSPTHQDSSATTTRITHRPFKMRLGDDNDIMTATSPPTVTSLLSNTSDSTSPPFPLSRQRSFSNPDLTQLLDDEVPLEAAKENNGQTLNPLAMDYFPSFHNSELFPPLMCSHARSTNSTNQASTRMIFTSQANSQLQKSGSSFRPQRLPNMTPMCANMNSKLRQRLRPPSITTHAQPVGLDTTVSGFIGNAATSSSNPTVTQWSGQKSQWPLKTPVSHNHLSVDTISVAPHRQNSTQMNQSYSQMVSQSKQKSRFESLSNINQPTLHPVVSTTTTDKPSKPAHIVHPFAPAWPQQHPINKPGYFKDAIKNKSYERGVSPPTSVAKLFNEDSTSQSNQMRPILPHFVRPQPSPLEHGARSNNSSNQHLVWTGDNSTNQPMNTAVGFHQSMLQQSNFQQNNQNIHPLDINKVPHQEAMMGQPPVMGTNGPIQPKTLSGTPTVAFNQFVHEFMTARNVVSQNILQQQVQTAMRQQQHFQQHFQQQLQLQCMQQQQQQQQQLSFQQGMIRHPPCQWRGANSSIPESSIPANYWNKPPLNNLNNWRQQNAIRQENIIKLTKQIQGQK